MDDEISLKSLRSQGLLTPEQEQELQAWFRASCLALCPLDLPEPLAQALCRAVALASLDPHQATMH